MPDRTDQPLGVGRVVTTGLVATVVAVTVTTLAAALARAVGVDLDVSGSDEDIPLSGIAVVTGVFSVVGTAIAGALRRWSARPSERFLWATSALTAVSLVPPLAFGADAATRLTLVGLHLAAAAVMIPALARALRARP